MKRHQVQFVLDAIRRVGHWFANDDTADLLARKFRDYLLAQCMNAGLTLSGVELDLIDAWFIATTEIDAVGDAAQDIDDEDDEAAKRLAQQLSMPPAAE